jgi:hypothetical protein
MFLNKRAIALAILSLLVVNCASAQFLDSFKNKSLALDSWGVNGWAFYAGDGSASMTFSQSGNGYASIRVDATNDKRGIWWALIKRCISNDMNLSLLRDPRHSLRIEARIRVSDAPKRINLHLNTQRTTDFHTHLMEFDIPDTTNWHTISMTTHGFDTVPGDTVYGQLALMDWGLEKYRVDIDYFKVDIVDADSSAVDLGVQVPYHPPVPDVNSFKYHLPVVHDCAIDLDYPNLNFNNWSIQDEKGRINLLTVSGSQFVILRWDLQEHSGQEPNGSGLLELTTYSLLRSPEYAKDFGMIRIVEIIGGDSAWDQKDVTADRFFRGLPSTKALNSQMVIDVDITPERGGKTLATIPKVVLQRLLKGKTRGLAIKPLGAVSASFYGMEYHDEALTAKLHFNLDSHSSTSFPRREEVIPPTDTAN